MSLISNDRARSIFDFHPEVTSLPEPTYAKLWREGFFKTTAIIWVNSETKKSLQEQIVGWSGLSQDAILQVPQFQR
jgi:hypothetical protein